MPRSTFLRIEAKLSKSKTSLCLISLFLAWIWNFELNRSFLLMEILWHRSTSQKHFASNFDSKVFQLFDSFIWGISVQKVFNFFVKVLQTLSPHYCSSIFLVLRASVIEINLLRVFSTISMQMPHHRPMRLTWPCKKLGENVVWQVWQT